MSSEMLIQQDFELTVLHITEQVLGQIDQIKLSILYPAEILAKYGLIFKLYHILFLGFDHVDNLNCILQANGIILIRIDHVFMFVIIKNLQHFLTAKSQTASEFYQSFHPFFLFYYLWHSEIQKNSPIVMMTEGYVRRLNVEVNEMDAMEDL